MISGSSDRPRLRVFKSNKHIYAQIIDDAQGKTLVAASTVEKGYSKDTSINKVDEAKKIGTLIAQAILSWVRPHSPLMPVASQLTRPFTAPIQRLVPPVANIDLSPLIAIVLAQLVLIFLG